MKIRYKTIRFKISTRNIRRALKIAGEHGWELVDKTSHEARHPFKSDRSVIFYYALIFMKRVDS